MQKTALYDAHVAANARIVEFCSWQMPINYGSQIKEHEAVRTDAGMFDVSHMAITDIKGIEAKAFLRYLLSNDVEKLDQHGVGKALYSGMLDSTAGVIDDLIVYYTPFGYRLVTNAGTYVKDMAWISNIAGQFKVELIKRIDLSIIAVQGPNAVAKVSTLNLKLAENLNSLKAFTAYIDGDWFYARTGYTGEDGLEIMLPNKDAVTFWNSLLNLGVHPCGLAARDTLRLEAGMNLYGHDMDEAINPLFCNMDWVVDLKDATRDFIGRKAYLELKSLPPKYTQVGLVLEGKGVLREGQKIYALANQEVGVITSGTFSPTLKKSIAFARIEPVSTDNLFVDIRGQLEPVKIVKLPFYRGRK